jgi:bifunctional non-homologous end joining protein LigD
MARAAEHLVARQRPRRGKPAAAAMPRDIEPMLATLGELPADQQNYNFEYKWDGIRALSYFDGRSLLIQSRNQLNITNRYPELSALAKAMGKRSVILDGEIVALDSNARPSFKLLQNRMHVNDDRAIARLVRSTPILYVLFDVLYVDGQSLIDVPYEERRDQLEELTVAGPAWQITPAHRGEGAAMLESARQNHLEGVVAKRLDSIYEPGRRSRAWIKIKITARQEFVIGGWIPESSGRARRVGAMLIGYYDCDGKLRYAGAIGTGLRAKDHEELVRMFGRHRTTSSPFDDAVPRKDAQFLKPDLVAEVEYRRWPDGGLVQQGSYKGLREDKPPREVVKESFM